MTPASLPLEEPIPTPTNQRASLKDVCRLAGVSKATVSRVLNQNPNVNIDTRDRVQLVIKSLGYTPSITARNLLRKKTDLIGLVLPNFSSGYYATVIRGVDHCARARGYHLIVSFTHQLDHEFNAGASLLEERRIDGIITLQPLAARETCRKLEAIKRPAVLLQKLSESSSLPFVTIDNFQGGFDVAHHLIDCGYRKILAVAGPEESDASADRLRGCKAAIEQSPHRAKIELMEVIHTRFKAKEAIPEVLACLEQPKSKWPDAIFAFNDDMALGLLQVFRQREIHVPEDIGLVGFDGIDAAEFAGLTTLETPLFEMGNVAANLLIDQIDGVAVEKKHVFLLGKLVVRHTTRAKS